MPPFSLQEVTPKLDADPGSCAVQGGNLNLQCELVHGRICEATRNLSSLYREHDRPAEADSMDRSTSQDLGCGAR